ncbi:hypothetical protein BLA60_18900 [Actinophytocola xinjiangensis]|uniref:Carrier domain-containing protein n=1 Tax=Actinophytocola xinjiangensis TaxID=485602 RepID=A0A7Z1AX83_9PSEU|nr:hypothetical protein BLA60_18900 [Actinophytocola xinjiangensis]
MTSPAIHRLVGEVAARNPEAVAVSWPGGTLTYRALMARANALAAELAGHGVGPESRVAVALSRSADFVVAVLAVLKAGGAYVPVDPAYPAARRELMLADAGADLVIAAEGDGHRTLGLAGRTWPAFAPEVDVPVGPDNLAYLIYTSGSTGVPKGVAVTHGAVLNLVTGDGRLATGAGDVVAHLAPTAFDASVFEIWCALGNGARVALLGEGQLSIGELGAALRSVRPDRLFLTTGLFHLLVDHDVDALGSVGVLYTGGDVLSPRHVLAASAAIGDRVHAAYGPTETTVFASLHAIGRGTVGERVPLGTALGGRTMHVLGPDLAPVPDGEPGEICLGGAGVARGYHRRPGLTAERFVPDPFSPEPGARLYRTGDLGRLLPEGTVEFLGRADRQVKVRGFRVELGEIEAALAAHEAVGAAAVVAAQDGHGKRVVAYAAPAAGGSLTAARLRSWLARRLPEYLHPANYVLLDALPLDPNGKVDRAALPTPWTVRAELAHLDLPPYVRPSTDTERAVCAAFMDVLALDQVGVHDNFFQLGGDSLRSVQVLQQLRDHGIDVGARQFFRNPTAAQLVGLVET